MKAWSPGPSSRPVAYWSSRVFVARCLRRFNMKSDSGFVISRRLISGMILYTLPMDRSRGCSRTVPLAAPALMHCVRWLWSKLRQYCSTAAACLLYLPTRSLCRSLTISPNERSPIVAIVSHSRGWKPGESQGALTGTINLQLSCRTQNERLASRYVTVCCATKADICC